MANLKFADTHNMVAFLSKPAESEGFEQIVDFLNANPIKYALTINPTIYISCIEQFWATVKAKTVNGEVQLQALVDGKKIIITESTVRRDLQLEDAEGVDCLPNATIFEQLTLMSPKTTAWNEFSSTMASAIICLATNQKFNFSKFIFESMVKNLDNVGKFLMYPRFVQVFLDKQLEGMSNHNRIYVTPSHTKKIFGNMRRVGKGFSGRETPLFPTMVVHNQEEMGEGSAIPTDPHHTPTFIQPSPQPQKTQKPRRPKKKDTQVPQSSVPSDNVADEAVYKELDDSLVRAATTASSLEAEQDSGNIIKTRSKATPNEAGSQGTTSGGGPRRQETMGDTIAQTRVLGDDSLVRAATTASSLEAEQDSGNIDKTQSQATPNEAGSQGTTSCGGLRNQETMGGYLCSVLDLEKTKTTQANQIASLKRRVKKLEKRISSRTHKLKRLYKVGLTARVEFSRDEQSLGEDASKQGRINAIDVDEAQKGRKIDDIDADETITLAGHDDEMFDVDVLNDEEMNVEQDVAREVATTTTAKDVDLTIREVATTTTISSQQSQDKGKGIMIEPERPMKKKDQLSFDEENAKRLQVEFDEEDRLARERERELRKS
ncbi:hypothetical protein Tco_0716265 [Tanacetum coccineum]